MPAQSQRAARRDRSNAGSPRRSPRANSRTRSSASWPHCLQSSRSWKRLKAQLQAEVSDPAFYARPHTEVAAQLARLAGIDAQIEAAFARWSKLEGA